MKERLEELLLDKGLTAAKLAEMMGVQASGISHIMSGRNYPSYEFLTRLGACFPDVNMDWLLLGKGDKYKTAIPSPVDALGGNADLFSSCSAIKPITRDLVKALLFYSDGTVEEYKVK